MTDAIQNDYQEAKRRTRRQRLLAVLGAGLVLGVGGVATLASWTDEEHLGVGVTTGDFETGGVLEIGIGTGYRTNTTLETPLLATIENTRSMGPIDDLRHGQQVAINVSARLSAESHPDIQSAYLMVDEIHVHGSENNDISNNISFEIYVRETQLGSGCDSNTNVNNLPVSTTGELFASGDSLDDIEHANARGFPMTRGQATRLCTILKPDGRDLIPNESFDVIFEFTLRP